jgi:uncharacterized protein (DUF433 family)
MIPTGFTTNEAGFVLERSNVAINKAVDTGLIHARVARGPSGRGTRGVGRPELRFLKLADALDKELTALGRRKLYEAIRRLPEQEQQVRVGVLVVELSPFDHAIDARIDRLALLKSAVEQAPSGEILIRGTSIPAHLIAGLAKGQTVGEIIEDYPSLSREQVERAIEYARAYPKKGRPYPSRSLKRALADLDLDGIAMARTSEGPRLIPV